MSTILDIFGSYITGGVVLLGLIGIIFYYSAFSQQSQLRQVSQKTIAEAGSVIEYDFNKLGYRVESGNKISGLTDSTISFRADLDNNGVVDSISYKLITISGKKNIRRYVSNTANGTWDLSCKNLFITTRDSAGSVTSLLNKIKSIELAIRLEQDSSSNMSAGSFWKRQFFPRNL